MELLYVWIEDYNNIHHQGFNFSPKHRFHFEPNEKEGPVTGGSLTHDDKINPNYPDNFFGEHISNMTAIVGKNGSGKSSLVNCIREYDSSLLIVFEDNTDLKYWINNSGIELSCDSISIVKEVVSTNFFNRIIYYSPFINSNAGYLNRIPSIRDISNIGRLANAIKDVEYKYPSNELPDTPGHTSSILISAFCAQEMNSQIAYICDEKNKHLIDFSLPSKIELSFPFLAGLNDSYLNVIKNIPGGKETEESSDTINSRFFLYSIFNVLNKDVNDNNIVDCPQVFSATEETVLAALRELCHRQHYEYDEIENLSKALLGHWKNDFLYNSNKLSFEFNIDEIRDLDIFSKKDGVTDHWIPKTWVLDLVLRLTWHDLSDGEATLLSLFARLWEVLKANHNSSIILLDEFDLGLHPQWQKEAIARLITFLKSLDAQGHHLIVTSHSPILTSDLPRENIIFLNKNIDGQCKVKEPQDMERTFGANIHNLYRSSFFMQDGLMGEFAKEKIDGVIKDLRGDSEISEERKTEIRFIIDTIGEDVLRTGLEKLYEGRFPLTEKEKLEKEIEHHKKKQVEAESKLKALN